MNLEQYKDDVKARLDLRDLVGRYGLDLKKVNATTSKCCCVDPMHTEKTPSCHVHPDYWYCYGCGQSGDAFSFLMDRERVDFIGALKMAGDMVNVPFPERQMSAQEQAEYDMQKRKLQLMRAVLDACQGFYRDCLENQPVGEDALKYCSRRGWTSEVRELFGLGYAPDSDVLHDWVENQLKSRGAPHNAVTPELVRKAMHATGMMGKSDSGFEYLRFKARVMFPIHDDRGRLCGFSGRAMTDDAKAKYLNTPVTELFDKGGLLYGLHVAGRSMGRNKKALLVEGQPDVIAYHLAGVDFVAGTMGTALTTKHLKLLKRFTDDGDVFMHMDGDKAGQKALRKTTDVKREFEMSEV